MCSVLKVHPSGYYAWQAEPASSRAKEDEYLLGFIKQFWLESGSVYGYRKIYKDLISIGEQCGKNRVHRLMKSAGIQSERGYKRKAHYPGGNPAAVAPNLLDRKFDVTAPNLVWVTDITYIRTYEGWLYLAVVMDFFSRQIIGWSMGSRIDSELAMNALVMACWRRKPQSEVIVHSDQGCQYTSYDWRTMLNGNGLVASMSRRGNCHDNAVAESFFQFLKRERIRKKIYTDRDAGRRDVFDYIELFYNPVRRHGNNNDVSPVEFERQYFMKLQRV